ncbi:MAG: oxidoreductase, partial [Verrucomicrobia bacterium RIFCSPLOWO2_12_FULL_64_8]
MKTKKLGSDRQLSGVDRRDFVKSFAAAGLAVAIDASPLIAAAAPGSRRKRYAIVGVGIRSRMFQNAIETTFRDEAELVAICDLNPGRIEASRRQSVENKAPPPPGYRHTDFEKMIQEVRPDHVIVTTPDGLHDEYIVRALEAGCDAISEKPLTTTAEKCQRILDAKRRTGRRIRVTFNNRYSPIRTQMKELLMSGEIGDVQSVDLRWVLNTHHGADYFRRWHSRKKNSGGLLVHKSTHHFDLINWWLGAVPVSVQASGKREFYTPATARRFGLQGHHERCHTCPEKDACAFFLDIAANPMLKALYLDNEQHDGYFRDQCVWRPEIDIEDSMGLLVRYDTGATLTYSLNAFCSWEGHSVAFNGTLGRLEYDMVESGYLSGLGGGRDQPIALRIRLTPLRGAPRQIEPWPAPGPHLGGDEIMLKDLFLPDPPPDKYLRAADERAAAASALIGIAA